MTSQEFQEICQEAETALVDLIKSVVAPNAKVYSRDVFADDEKVFIGRLKNQNNKVHCWSVQYAGTGSEEDFGAVATETFKPVYKIIGYLGYDFGTDVENSAKTFQNELNALRFAFMNKQTLGCDFVTGHSGFTDKTTLAKIDRQDVHLARVDLTITLQELPYDYN